MEKGFAKIRILSALCCILLVCGCFKIQPNIKYDSTVKSKPDIYVRDCYKDFKKGQIIKDHVVYFLILLSIIYLVTNFIYDFMYLKIF